MTPRTWTLLTLTTGLFLTASAHAQTGPRVLFDAAHAQLAGNADWVLDEDGCGNVPRFPTPAQSGITASTPESYWTGAYSSFGVALAKAGYQLESLPPGNTFTYGTANPQDLTNYKVLVIPEPNTRFSAAEISALQSFVQNGGGLYMIGDHSNSDRNNDGYDAPEIFNELMVGTAWGLHFQVAPEPDNDITNDPDANYTADTTSPIVYTGPFGAARAGAGLSLHGSTTITLDPVQNPSVRGHVWSTSGTRDTNTRVTLATGGVGAGRIAAIGDSGPTEDITNGCNDTTFDDINLTSRDNATLALNVVAWLATTSGPAPDTTPPSAPTNLVASAASTSQIDLTWTAATDNVGVASYNVYRSLDGSNFAPYINVSDTGFADTGLAAATTYSYRVTALDNAGNESPASAVAAATTFAPPPPRVIINEILANELGTNTAGEFVELVNAGTTPVTLDGWTVSDGVGVRHVFAAGTTLSPGRALVVFASASAIPAGLSNAVGASSNALGLGNSGDTVTVRDAGGAIIDTFTYPLSLASRDGVSMNRSPDGSASGTFVLHTNLSTLANSPGRRVSGASF
ncbi:MAG TPA: lamin tail domain-containing protein [Polyangia bacterium]|jgi:chitodextrinase|nr:lamin tail domain-containing protein [Polyangia bacterium]